jgi:hypothetical protein
MDAPFFRCGRLAFTKKNGGGEKPPILETEDGRFLYCDLADLKLVAR